MKRADLPRVLGLSMAEIQDRVRRHGLRWPSPDEDISTVEFDAIKAAVEADVREHQSLPGEEDQAPSRQQPTAQQLPSLSSKTEIRWEHHAKKWRGRQRGIGVIGLAGSGKTAYLFVLGYKHYLYHLKSWRIAARTEEFNSFVTKLEPMLQTGWPKTNPNEPPRVFELFTLLHKHSLRAPNMQNACPAASVSKNGLLKYVNRFAHYLRERALASDIPVRSFDVAGELIRSLFTGTYDDSIGRYNQSDIDSLCEAICATEGLLVILDSEIAADPASADTLQKEQSRWDFIFERLCKIDSGQYGQYIERPVAIVLNKADYFVLNPTAWHNGDLLGVKDLLALRREPVADTDEQTRRDTFNDRVDKVRAFVRQRYPTIYTYVERVSGERKLKHVGFFAMSCWGKHPAPPDKPGMDIYPTLVEEPLEWLADAILKRRVRLLVRSKLRRVLVTLALAAALILALGLCFAVTSQIAYHYALRAQQSRALTLTIHNPVRHVALITECTICDRRIASIWYALYATGTISMDELRHHIAPLRLPDTERVRDFVNAFCSLEIPPTTAVGAWSKRVREGLQYAPSAGHAISNKAARVFLQMADFRAQRGEFQEAIDCIKHAQQFAQSDTIEAGGLLLRLHKSIAIEALKNGKPQQALAMLKNQKQTQSLDEDAQALLVHAERAANMIFIPGGTSGAAFYLDKYEVTNKEYERFRPRHTLMHARYEEFSPDPDCPVIFVSYDDAREYAAWVQKRLPTNAEWQRAADELLPRIRSLRINSLGAYMRRTVRVNSNEFPDDTTVQGVRHLLGNVAEWVASDSGALARGTSWLDSSDYLTRKLMNDYRDREVGFRCAMDCLP